MKLLSLWMVGCVFLAALLGGCVPGRQVPVDLPPPLQPGDCLLLIPSSDVAMEKDFYAIGTGEGLKRGMGEGALAGGKVGLELTARTLPWSLFPPVAAAFMVSGVVVGGVGGGIAGGIRASDAEDVKCVEENLRSALDQRGGNEHLVVELQTHLHELGADLPLLSTPAEGHSYLLPKLVGVEFMELPGPGKKVVSIVLKSTVLRVDSVTVKSFGNIDYYSPPKTLEGWCQAGAEGFLRELDIGLAKLSERIADRLLLEEGLSVFSNPGCPAYRGLAPVLPEVKRHLLKGLRFSPVENLQPVLEWEPFPRAIDAEKDPDLPARLAEVVYDLRIWQPGSGQAPWVYSRTGLTQTTHQVEKTLQSDSEYYWAVRPRFLLDGMWRVLPWSIFGFDCLTSVPAQYAAYRFSTPKRKRAGEESGMFAEVAEDRDQAEVPDDYQDVRSTH